ncbi:glycosyltransferase family 87 protein [Pedobacter aquatilis]|uniref:glycosyltransferase family 87 protein n=1 Tax=Pedobacter aquatilis TaxID=351343 RepID=UPI00292E16CA|nr:glycosyltransferase family 87 protein [Pedobacter aquatilis]
MNTLSSANQTNYSFSKIYEDHRFAFILWLAVTLIFVIDSWITNRLNNYLIFENTFRNLLNQQSFYDLYPDFHNDANHYGPIFSLIIAPFAALPNWLGLLFWNLFNCIFLFKAVQTLPVSQKDRLIFCYIALPCLIESMLNQQFNAAAGALIILNYTQLNKAKGFWAAMFMVLGVFVKLYGIVGLAFFFFVKDKPRYILYSLFWALVFFMLPMLFSSPLFVTDAYFEWFVSLTTKNAYNVSGVGIDMSIMGFFRQLCHSPILSNSICIGTGALLFMLPYLNIKSYKKKGFQLLILASALLFPVLFSTGAEDCTFIISIAGVGIWYVLEKNKILKNILLPVLLITACDFPLLFFPEFSKSHRIMLSMLSFPYFLVWIRILYKALMYKKIFKNEDSLAETALPVVQPLLS